MNFESYILIGGKSSRMGEDKFALRLNGKTFLEIAVETLQNFGNISVVGSQTHPLTQAVLTVEDIYLNRGALGGIHSALTHSKSDWTIILACDYPFVTNELVEFLQNIAKVENDLDAFAPIQADGKTQPLCAIYNTETCRKILSEMLANESENYSVRDFLNRIKTRYIEFSEIAHLPNAEHFFFNVNTPEDFDLATKLHEKNTKKASTEIFQMSNNDIEEVIKIQQESNLSYWSYEGYVIELEKENSFLITAKIDIQVVGFLVAEIIKENNCAEIYNIAVDSNFRRNKVGVKLLESLVEKCFDLEKIFLEVRESNETAIKFYLKNNFAVIGKRKNFYSNPTEDAILMEKKI